jgi:Big-like domain-containing protein
VIWASSVATAATISNSSGTQGLATSSGTGVTTISATLGAINASTTLTVQTAALISLGLTPQNPSLPLGTTQQFTATGNYSDGSSQNITSAVIWASSVATAATISNSSGTQGLATSSGTGVTTISATLGAINASTTLTVQTAALISLGIIPQNPTIVVGTTQQFTATGTYSDGTARDLTATTSWSSSPVAAATISNTPGTIGLARGVGAGTATITGASGSQSGTANLTVVGSGQPLCFYTTSWNTGSVSYLGNAITHSETGKNYFIFDGPAFYVASPCITSNLAFVVGQVDIYKTHYACQGGPSTANNGASCNYCSGTSCQPVPSVCKGGASCSGPLPNNYDVGIYCVGGGACNFGQLYAHVGPLAVAQFFDCANHPTQCGLAKYLAIQERYVLKLSWVSGPVSLPTGNYAIGMATNCDSSKQPERIPGRASGDSGCGAGMGEGGPYGYGSGNPRVSAGTQLMSFKYFTESQPCLVYDEILGLPANIGPGSPCNFSSIPANGAGQAPHILNFAIY